MIHNQKRCLMQKNIRQRENTKGKEREERKKKRKDTNDTGES